MGDHYRRRIKELLAEYNRPFPGPFYFERFLKKKSSVVIADLGSGPVCTLGNLWSGVDITIRPSDILQPEYAKLVAQEQCQLLIPIEYQDMENLTYADAIFDVVHCVNALDHTPDVAKALAEMKRVCKVGGYIYLRHGHNQKTVNGGRGHYWDATRRGFYNGETHVSLDGFTTIDDGYFLVSIYKKDA